MVNQPNQDTQGVHTPASKLVLPEPPDAGQQRQRYSSPQPGRLINQPASAATHGLFTRLVQRLRTDPAFALLSLAVTLVVITSFIFVSLSLSALAGGNGPAWNKSMVQHPVVPAPAGTIDLNPKFPTPSSRKGSHSGSQPTPGLQPSPTSSSDQGTLTVQITNIPDVVQNQSQIQVGVQTNESHVSVHLQVTYNAWPFFYNSRESTTNASGNADLLWNVRVRSFTNGNNVTANVVVIATDQGGQQATSDPFTVEIT